MVLQGCFHLCDYIIAQLRETSKTQAQLAHDLGIAQGTISKWLAGQAKPGCDSIDLILAAYPDIREGLAVELLAWEA